jgi:hypothetical protein
MAACSTLPLWHVLSLLGVVTIVCGATGGLASYLLMGPMPRTTHHTLPNDPQEPGKETRRHPLHEHPLMGHVLLGITAALVVPLFLSLSESRVIERIVSGVNNNSVYENWLIYIGFCIVAAVACRKFMQAVSGQVLAALRDHSQDIKDHHKRLRDVEQRLDAVGGQSKPGPDDKPKDDGPASPQVASSGLALVSERT